MRSGTMDARSRTALVRLLWDFIGTEFGSRHQQYEKFYGGSSFVVKQNVYRNYDFKRATALVDNALGAAAGRRRAHLDLCAACRDHRADTSPGPSPCRSTSRISSSSAST